MPRGKPRSEWSPAYRHRIESAEARGFTRKQARGIHPDEAKGTLGIRAVEGLRLDLRSATQEPRVVVEGDRVVVTTTDDQGKQTVVVMNKATWDQVRPKGRPRSGVTRPKIWQYRKRRRAA